MDRPTTISACGISKSFGKQRVLVDLSLSATSGECIQLLGDNGSGKTTLLRALSTLLSIDTGSLIIDGIDSRQNKKSIRGKIGFLGHQSLVYSQLTVLENLSFSSMLFQILDFHARIQQVLDFVGLAIYKDRRAGMLSHGLRKRISLARVLLQNPKILLLDEPETGLDSQGISILKELINTNRAKGGTIVMTTHNPESTRSLADRTLVLVGGKTAPSL